MNIIIKEYTITTNVWLPSRRSISIVQNKIIKNPETIATAIRIGNPASWQKAVNALDESNGLIDSVTDEEILEAYQLMTTNEGVFSEPASNASIAGLIKLHRSGKLPKGKKIVAILTGNGLKDPDTAISLLDNPIQPLPNNKESIIRYIKGQSSMEEVLKLKIPASTANLGVGFDSIGMALDKYLHMSIRKIERSNWEFLYYSSELEGLPKDENNYIYQTALNVAHKYNVTLPSLQIEMRSDIPLARGLGSSASALVGALLLLITLVIFNYLNTNCYN